MVRDESVQMMQADVGVGTADLEIGRGYVKQLQIVWHDRLMPGLWLGSGEAL